MLRAAYPRDRLGMPIALRTGAIGVAAATGPILGGALAAHFGWRSVFFLGVAPAVAVGVLALVVRLPADGPRTGVALDLPGACLLALALVCLVHTLAGIPENGRPAATTLGFLAVAAAGAAFVRHGRRTPGPLVPPGVLRSATVASALGVLVTASAALFGALFVGTYFLQDVLALDPMESGLRVLPLAATMVLGAPVSAVLLRRYGPRRTAGAGMVLVALGILLFSRLDRAATAPEIGGCFFAVGAGFGTVMVTATAVIVHHASLEHAGVAGGLQQTAMNIGPTLGVAAATLLLRLPGGGAFATAMGPALTALAAVAAIGALLALRLPVRMEPESAPDGIHEGPPHEAVGSGGGR